MKYKSIAILIFCVSMTATMLAQSSTNDAPTQIVGAGTPGFIAGFSGTHTIRNSAIFQSRSGIGVGTTNPGATLDVETNGQVAVKGATNSTAVNTYGVYGQTASTDFGAGVLGNATATTGAAFGVYAVTAGPGGSAVFGYASATSGNPTGVAGYTESPNTVAGQFVAHSGSGLILQGLSGSNLTQVFTVDAQGNGYFAGNLTKGSGSFKIDHPLDPANKYLEHSFVESPDMMNIYNGVVRLDDKGKALVKLPEYFEALNSDFRYQLTAIGAPGPNLHVAEEISGNHFKIAGGKPGAKVSWQVTGVRQDAYAKAHRINPEEDKPAQERGHYLHPELFGATEKEAIGSNIVPAIKLPVTAAETSFDNNR